MASRCSRRSLTHEFTHLMLRMKDLPRVRFHDLRHSHATRLLLAGVHPKIAQERLGHSTITTTLDLYSHVTETMQEDAAAKIDAVFRSAITGGAGARCEAFGSKLVLTIVDDYRIHPYIQ
jgi:integrase